MAYCPNCGAQLRDTARFCGECGQSLQDHIRCTVCGSENPPAARYCQSCGRDLQTGILPGQVQAGGLPVQTVLQKRYRIVRRLGQGGMGAVYLGEDLRLGGVQHAIKEMSDAALTDGDEKRAAVAQFNQEAVLLSRLAHPNLPRVTDYFAEGGKFYLVMDFVEGHTLDELLARQTVPFAETQVLVWVDQLCDVLAYLHNQNPPIIYRDMKPGNVMLAPDGRQVYLIDFGIVRVFKAAASKDTSILGTPGYAPPEQYGRRQTDQRSDVYALGAMLHHLLTLKDPSEDPFIFMPAATINPAVSPLISAVIARAVEMDADRRWQSAADMRAALKSQISLPTATAGSGVDPHSQLWNVILENGGLQLIEVIKALRILTSMGLLEAKQAVDRAPCPVLTKVDWDTAQAAQQRLAAAGAQVLISPAGPAQNYPVPVPTSPPKVASRFEVILHDCGPKKIETIKVIRQVTNLGLAESKTLSETFGAAVVRDVSWDQAEQIRKQLAAVGASAVVQVSGPPPGPAPARSQPAVAAGSYDVILRDCGPKKIETIKVIRQVTAIGLVEAKNLSETPGAAVVRGVTWEQAERIRRQLQAAGAVVSLEAAGSLLPYQAPGPAVLPQSMPTANGYRIILSSCGPKKIEVILIIRQVTNLDLFEAKNLVEIPNSVVAGNLTWDQAEEIRKKLEAAGAVARIGMA